MEKTLTPFERSTEFVNSLAEGLYSFLYYAKLYSGP